jgi:hypothetical protein
VRNSDIAWNEVASQQRTTKERKEEYDGKYTRTSSKRMKRADK